MNTSSSARVFDSICGMWLEPQHIMATYTYIGHIYRFCSAECRDLFARTPDIHVLRLAHDSEGCIAHCCPLQRHEVGASNDCVPPLCQIRHIE